MNETLINAIHYMSNVATQEATVDDLLDYLKIPVSDRTGFGTLCLLEQMMEFLNNSVTE